MDGKVQMPTPLRGLSEYVSQGSLCAWRSKSETRYGNLAKLTHQDEGYVVGLVHETLFRLLT